MPDIHQLLLVSQVGNYCTADIYRLQIKLDVNIKIITLEKLILTKTIMATEVLLHIKENLDDETMRKLIDTLSEECGGSKPHFDTNKPHQMFISYDENKISLHDIPDIAMKHGVHIDVIG